MAGGTLTKAIATMVEREFGGYTINIISASHSGISDLICCIKGMFFAFEVKYGLDTEKALQDEHLKAVAKAGGYGGYVRSVADARNIINNKLKPKITQKTAFRSL